MSRTLTLALIGALTLAGAGMLAVAASPLLSVVDPRSKLIPPDALVPFHEATSSPRKALLHYEGDVGVNLQHVGVLQRRHGQQDAHEKRDGSHVDA